MNAASDPIVCVFPHGKSEGESSSPDKLVEFLRDELPTQRDGRYRLRGLTRTRPFAGSSFADALVPGSIVLFKMKGRIWGAAKVKEGISRLDPPEPVTVDGQPGHRYRYALRFHADKIAVYDSGIPVELIEEATGPDGPDLTTGIARALYRVLGYQDTVLPKIQPLLGLPPGW